MLHCTMYTGSANISTALSVFESLRARTWPRLGMQGFFGADCGNEAARLVWDTPLMRENAAFEYDFFQLPDLNPSALTHSIEVRLRSIFPKKRYGAWLEQTA